MADEAKTFRAALADEDLRDWFAGQAMTGCMTFVQDSAEYQRPVDWDYEVQAAYAMADAMMAERKRRREAK